MRRHVLICMTALLLVAPIPLAAAEDVVQAPDDGTVPGGGEGIPCYAVDTTVTPPRVYEVPC